MQLNYSKEAIDSEFDLFEITTECRSLLKQAKPVWYLGQRYRSELPLLAVFQTSRGLNIIDGSRRKSA